MKKKVLVFEEFLIDNGVNTEYFKALCIDDALYNEIGNIFLKKATLVDFRSKCYKLRGVILYSFTMGRTTEGYKFWNELDEKWRTLSDDFNEEDIYFGFGLDYDCEAKVFLTKDNLKIIL